jgi:hypothetical protein
VEEIHVRLEKNREYLTWHTTFMLRALEWSDHNKV